MSHDEVVARTVAPPSVPSRSTLLRAALPLLRACRPVQANAATARYVVKPVPQTHDASLADCYLFDNTV